MNDAARLNALAIAKTVSEEKRVREQRAESHRRKRKNAARRANFGAIVRGILDRLTRY